MYDFHTSQVSSLWQELPVDTIFLSLWPWPWQQHPLFKRKIVNFNCLCLEIIARLTRAWYWYWPAILDIGPEGQYQGKGQYQYPALVNRAITYVLHFVEKIFFKKSFAIAFLTVVDVHHIPVDEIWKYAVM